MSAYENVVKGKLKLKGKALDVKAASGISKKKKKHTINHDARPTDSSIGLASTDHSDIIEADDDNGGKAQAATLDNHLTPAERRYLERWQQIEHQRLAKLQANHTAIGFTSLISIWLI